jgi:hypothetical protein
MVIMTAATDVAAMVKALYFVGPTGKINKLALRTGAHHPTGVDIRMIEGLISAFTLVLLKKLVRNNIKIF